jgi:hypothetical protein
MKNKINTVYWVVMTLMAGFMLLASIPDVLSVPQAVEIFRHLGYPTYLLPFLGTAKILGIFSVLVPGFDRLKEWAYAGLTFDVVGALYSHLCIGDPVSMWAFPVIALVLVGATYVLARLRIQQRASSAVISPQHSAGRYQATASSLWFNR